MAEDAPRERVRGPVERFGPLAAAVLVFVLAAAAVFSELAGRDPTRFAAANTVEESLYGEGKDAWDTLGDDDLRFFVWLISRNARVMMTSPGSLLDTEMCYPARRAMTYGESAITLGAMAVPAWWTTRDPVFTYTFVTLAISLAGALGMFLLVREWTGVAAAGIAAGLLYAFHEVKIGDVIHLPVWDNAWTIFALYFATRWFARRRLADALGLSASIALQVGGSMYPIIAAGLIALPFVPWLVFHYGLGQHRATPWIVVLESAALCVLFILGPYLLQRAEGGLGSTEYQFFRPLEWLAPGGGGFPGVVMLLGIAAALSLGRRRCLAKRSGDPRLAIGIAALLVFGLSVVGGEGTAEGVIAIRRGDSAPSGLPNLYMALSRYVPGFEVGRSPGAMYTGVHLLLAAMAGLGVAGIIRAVPRRFAAAAAVVLVAAAWIDTVRPAFLGLEPRVRLRAVEVRPSEEDLAFYARLAELGNDGPILELPMVRLAFHRASVSILNSAYHHRPVSHCYNSFYPPVTAAVESLSAELPEARAFRQLRRMGFTTIVVHHPPGEGFLERRQERFSRFAAGPEGRLLRRLHATETKTAYALQAVRPQPARAYGP